jgi:hypothetical protein
MPLHGVLAVRQIEGSNLSCLIRCTENASINSNKSKNTGRQCSILPVLFYKSTINAKLGTVEK